jgi:vitamin B12 transporter
MSCIHRHPRLRSAPLLVASFAACLVTTVTRAEAPPDATPLDPVVVSATRTPQPLSEALPATTVITRQDIEDSHAPDLPTLLRGQAGFDVTQQGGIGSISSLFLRGSNSNQVLVLVDGLRINAVGSGGASIAHLMIDQIDHVEIVRGNVSSLYGSEAVGGVVQIFTRGARAGDAGLVAEAAGSWGSEHTRAASAEIRDAFGPSDARTRVGLSASYRAADGFSAIDADRVAVANPDYDGYRNTSLSATLSQSFGEHEIGVRYFESHGHLEFDEATDYSFVDPTFNGRVQTQAERSRQTDASTYARLKPLSWWTIDLVAGQARDLSVSTASFPFSFAIETTTSTQRQYRFGNTLRVDAHAVTLAYERLDQTGFSSSFGNGVDGATFSRHVDALMAGYTGPLFLPAALNEFQLNARHDRYSDFGNANSGLVAYGFRFANDWKAVVQASNAFKAPAFNELFFPFFGNPALEPERANSFEVGLQYANASSLARISAFTTHTHDLIVFDPTLGLANNVSRARTRGVELTGRTQLDGWALTANVTLDRAVDQDTGQRLLRRATRNVNLAVAKSFGRFRFSGDFQAAGSRPDSDIVTFAPTTVAGYGVLNAGVRYDVLPNASVGVAVTNALDRKYTLVDGYNTAGRVALLNVEVRN